MTEISPETISRTLALELGRNDAEAATVRDYLLRLLHDVWEQGESFSGKRPFGNSAWDAEVYVPMIRAGIITGTLDEDGCIDEMDDIEAEALIFACIASLDNPADLREQLARLRESFENLAAGLVLSASTSRPSKKSEIEDACASAIRGILEHSK